MFILSEPASPATLEYEPAPGVSWKTLYAYGEVPPDAPVSARLSVPGTSNGFGLAVGFAMLRAAVTVTTSMLVVELANESVSLTQNAVVATSAFVVYVEDVAPLSVAVHAAFAYHWYA